MKKLKKIFAVLLTLAMVLGMNMTSFAADHKPQSTDAAEITVNGVKSGATVKAYKIAQGKWNDQGFIGYEAVEVGGVKIADVSKPTRKEITDIANAVRHNTGITGVVLEESASGVYTKNLEVGEYLIVVTENGAYDTTIYNPMVASVYYSTEKSGDLNDQIGGIVSAEDNFVVDGQNAYAKSENPTIDKKIVEPGSGNKKGDDTAIGDDINFEITTAFPAYSEAYTKAEFNIIDTLSAGLTLTEDSVTVVSVGNNVPVKGTDYTVTVDGQTMTIFFTSDCILANKGADVTVRYTAQLNENAGINFDKNTNTVYAEYTNNPTTEGKGRTEEKKTYHYTFGIDAAINGRDSEVTKEVYKINENGEVKVIEADKDRVVVTGPLAGAKFELRTKNGDVVRTVTSAQDGSLKMTGLDAGEYVLVETKAPQSYSLDATEHTFVITAGYNTDGTLDWYKVTVDGHDSTYSATYNNEKEPTIKYDEVASIGIKNTKLASLPSTGGIGTTIFTIGGCAIMIIAAALFFASRRKSAK